MYGSVFMIAVTLLTGLITAVVYGVGGTLVIRGALQFGTLVALAQLLTRVYGPIGSLSNVQVQVMTALVSFDRVFEVLDLEPLIKEKPDAVALPRTLPGTDEAPDIRFDHVSFRYPTAAEVSLASLESIALKAPERMDAAQGVLHDVSFTAPAGQLTALVGPSGAGKTTITQLVSRMYDPNDGAVLIGGHDLRDVTLDSLHDVVGVVTQDAHLFHDTIRANLLYARPSATEAELDRGVPGGADLGPDLGAARRPRHDRGRPRLPAVRRGEAAGRPGPAAAEGAVDRGARRGDRAPGLRVGGRRPAGARRVALRGRTSLVIAHRLSTVRDADQILVIEAGQVVERGTHEDLLAADGLYAELYHTQFKGQEIYSEAARRRSSTARSAVAEPPQFLARDLLDVGELAQRERRGARRSGSFLARRWSGVAGAATLLP